ncbi:hypothetical protein [Melioribacter roseus]|uniref:hypothetical protein n=1 Tax=Melioribacter roseus TaxID=1134405 RepID=UPI00059BD877|nr:hypothetical protein [Melioribacter roseus]
MKKLLLTLWLMLAAFSLTNAQTSLKGTFGLGIDGVDSPNLSAKLFLSDKVAMEFMAGLNLYAPGGDEPVGYTKVTGINYRCGLGFYYNFNHTENLMPYLGLDALFESEKDGGFFVTEPDAKNRLKLNFVLGAEYFISSHFSIGLKEKLGCKIDFSRDLPKEETDFYLITGAIITAKYYF